VKRFAGFVAAGLLGVGLLAGCGSHSDAASKPSASAPAQLGGTGQIGSLLISAAYVPEPASPDIAAAYVTVHNTGKITDTLLRASTPAGTSTSLHRDVTSGGTEGMVPLRSIPIPAGKTVTMKPGGEHLMIEHPKAGLKRGGQLELTLVFAHAGRLTMQVPIVSPAGLLGPMPSNMPGMDMGH
jgi:copper(I)-binding protein